MKIPTRCPVCDQLEDGGHLFLKCKLAKQLWRALGLEADRVILANKQLALDTVEFNLLSTEYKKLVMTTTLWYIWSERNLIREEGKRQSIELLARSVEIYVKEMRDAATATTVTAVSRARRAAQWVRSPRGTLKINCDGSF
jgi:hypothetical protein